MSDIQQNSIKAWVLAARPKTLSGAVMPVLIGGALALRQMGCDFNMVPFVLCVLFALIMQIDANFINDYYDFKKGTDRTDRLGPERACAQGWITMPCMLKGIILTTILACAVGAPLIFYGGWWMVAAVAKLWALLMLPYLLLHVLSYRNLQRLSGRELNKVLGQTARNILVFGILASVVVYMYCAIKLFVTSIACAS